MQGGEKPFTYGDCVSELATGNLEGETPREFIATMEVATVYLGDRLGLYRALADGGPATPAELAATETWRYCP